MEDQDFTDFIGYIKRHTTIDLSQYKETQMKRRLTTLRNKYGFPTFVAFYKELARNDALMNEFLDKMTINVSEFWRNANRWEVLEKKYIPEMLSQRSRIKCWSAACSSGEEPYTLGMILAERQALSSLPVLATDIDTGALEKARKGLYPERSVREVPAPYFKKYFRRNDASLEVSEELKKAVRFQKGNLMLDAFEKDFDLIICRNVIIYFTEQAKDLLFRKFAEALRPGGFFFVGSTEQIFNPGRYQLEAADSFFYRKLG